MENFKKFTSKALSNDNLSRIRGGAMHHTCEQAYAICASYSEICYPNYGEPTQGWHDCMADLNPNCSPLTGWGVFCEKR